MSSAARSGARSRRCWSRLISRALALSWAMAPPPAPRHCGTCGRQEQSLDRSPSGARSARFPSPATWPGTLPPERRRRSAGWRPSRQSSGERETASPTVTVLDVLPGENVTVVGDAHQMTALFPPATFDFVQSVSVFEHLVMPWKVALEMNRVMKLGALAFVFTHQ